MSNTKKYKCSCGETDPSKFYGHKKEICGKCHNNYCLKKGREKRIYAIKLLGGKCKKCGYKKHPAGFDIHHKSGKDPNFSSMRGWSIERINKELKNCILLCANCHREIHANYNWDIGV